ncbi:MAG: metallophosphoesterase, partial [Sulfolobales archaeon]
MLQNLEKEVMDLVRKPEDVMVVLMSFRDLLKEEHVARSRPRGLVEIEPRRHREAVVIGDIHGDLDTLIQLLSYVNIEKILESNGLLIFLGDYVDRGSKQLETLLFIALLKKRYRGN